MSPPVSHSRAFLPQQRLAVPRKLVGHKFIHSVRVWPEGRKEKTNFWPPLYPFLSSQCAQCDPKSNNCFQQEKAQNKMYSSTGQTELPFIVSANDSSTESEQMMARTSSSLVTSLVSALSLFFSLLMAFLCLAGAISNCLSLLIFAKASFRRRSINVLLCGLSLSDLCLCVLALPVFSLAQLQHLIPGFTPALTNQLLLICYPLCLMAQTMSVWMLVGITVDRWLAVCYPFSMRIHCTVKRARLTVLFVFLFSLAYNFVRFWEYRIDGATGQVVGLLRNDYLFMLLYQNLATTISQFLVPLCVLCPLNLQVARAILAARERRKTLWAELSAVEAEAREQSTAVMMLVVVLVFLLCYSCSNVLNVLEMLLPELFRSPAGFLLNDVNNVLVVFNSASSALFYARFSSRYRSQLICLLREWKMPCLPAKARTSRESTSRALSVGILLSRPKLSTTILSIGTEGQTSARSGRQLRAHSACPCPV